MTLECGATFRNGSAPEGNITINTKASLNKHTLLFGEVSSLARTHYVCRAVERAAFICYLVVLARAVGRLHGACVCVFVQLSSSPPEAIPCDILLALQHVASVGEATTCDRRLADALRYHNAGREQDEMGPSHGADG